VPEASFGAISASLALSFGNVESIPIDTEDLRDGDGDAGKGLVRAGSSWWRAWATESDAPIRGDAMVCSRRFLLSKCSGETDLKCRAIVAEQLRDRFPSSE
jgi:hypothetical protein